MAQCHTILQNQVVHLPPKLIKRHIYQHIQRQNTDVQSPQSPMHTLTAHILFYLAPSMAPTVNIENMKCNFIFKWQAFEYIVFNFVEKNRDSKILDGKPLSPPYCSKFVCFLKY